MRKPVCFIAMAFGREDSNGVYEKFILPILKRNNVAPVIINRKQSNDDLNFQIIEELKRADFCIADLTYTRPSVYYEAGFAQRSIPVIYTVRQDHLNKGQPEDLRVHFDLQMKPIISWKSENDSSFADRLEKRLRATVLREWIRSNNIQIKDQIERDKFSRLPLQVRLALLRRQTIYSMRQLGIKLGSWQIGGLNRYTYWQSLPPRKQIINGIENHITGATIRKPKVLLATSIQSYESLTIRSLNALANTMGPEQKHLTPELRKEIDTIFSNTVVLLLNSFSARQIEKVLPHFIPVEKGKRYTSPHTRTFQDHTVKTVSTFHFLSSINSLPHLKSLLEDVNQFIEKQLVESRNS